MSRSVCILTRSVLILTTLLTLVTAFAHPSASLRAQESIPPSPTAAPTSLVVSGQLPSRPGIAVVNSDGTVNTPAPESVMDIADRQPQKHDQVPILAPDSSANVQGSRIAPQSTQPPGTFQVNIIASPRAHADGLLTYSIYFTNTSSTTYQNVLLQNGIGNGQFYTGCNSTTTCPFTYTGDLARPTLVSVDGNGNDPAARQIVWGLGNVAPTRNGRISYTVRVQNNLFPQSGRPAMVLGTTVALYKAGAITVNNKLNEDQWGVLIVGPAFYLTKTSDKLRLLERDTINYTITVGNATGPNDKPNGILRPDAEDAHNAVVFDILPGQLTNIVPQNGGTVSVVNGETRITWNLGTLGREQTRQLHFSATVKDTLTDCSAMVNTFFYATSDELPIDPNTQSHYPIRAQIDTTSYIIPPATVVVSANPPVMKVRDAVEWTITAKNYWIGAMNGVTIKFNLPLAFTYDGNTPPAGFPPGTYDSSSKSVTWSGINLPPKVNFDSPGQLVFKVQSHAGRVIDRNDGIAQITQVPASVPTGCLKNYDEAVNVDPLLSAVKTVNSSLVLSGTDVIYTIVVNNIYAQPMNDVSLIDTLPRPRNIFQFSFKSMVSGPQPTSVTSTHVQWNNISVPGGTANNPGKTTLQFKATARGLPDDCDVNRVQPDSSISQAHEAAGALVCIDYPWIVTKIVDRTSVNPRGLNRTLLFTLTFKSRVSADQQIKPIDQFLQQPQYYYIFRGMIQGPPPLNTTPHSFQYIGDGVIEWAPTILPGMGTIVYKYQVDLPADSNGVITAGTYCNRGILWPLPFDQFGYWVYTRPDACTTASSIELRVSKNVNRHDVGLGETVAYVIYLENKSDTDTVGQLVISDTLPVNMTYVGPGTGSLAPTVTTLPNGQQRLRWNGVAVPPRTTTTLIFNARAPALIGTYRNLVEVSGGNPLPFFTCDGVSLSGNCLSYVDLRVYNWVTIDLQPTPNKVSPGAVVTYTLSLVSNNNIPYLDTIVTDMLPPGFSYLSMVSGPVPVQLRPDLLVWRNQTVPQLEGPTAGRLTFVFRARAPLGYGSFRSRVEASSPTGVIPTADNVARVLITPTIPALSILAPRLVEIGSDVTFRISLVNPNATPLTNVTITDPLPAGFTFTSVENGSPAPSISGQTLTWTISTVPAASVDGTPGIVEIVFHATAPNTEGTFTNTATATGSSTIDQTYNSVKMIVARLRYVYLPIVSSP